MRIHHPIHPIHPIQWFETVHWRDMLVDGRVWAILGIIGFIGLFAWMVVMNLKIGNMPRPIPYQGPWPYGPMPMP